MAEHTPMHFEADEPLPLTGERTAPGIPEENYWFQRHVIAYEFARALVTGKRVLDAGCGEGYGTAMLASTAAAVVGVDLEASVVRRAADLYPSAEFRCANLVSLPFEQRSFDAVVSLQVIEHLHTPQEFLAECARVLVPGGLIVIATPNRLTFSPGEIRNPFHAFEFAPDELRATLAKHFHSVDVLGVFHAARIRSWERWRRMSFPERQISQPAPEWPRRLRAQVSRVKAVDFTISREHPLQALDLIATARA